MYRFAWHLLLPLRRLAYWLTRICIRLFILFLIVIVLYFLFFSAKAGAQEPDFNFGKSVSLAGFRSIRVPGGWKNSCSQYVVASLLSALGTQIDQPLYDEIGHAINPDQTGASTSDIVSYLQTRFHCDRRMPATIDDIVRHLDCGLPVVTSVRVDATQWHLVIVVGYAANPAGEITELTIVDNGVIRGKYSPEEFSRLWSPEDSTGQPYCLLISPSEKTPTPQPLVLEDNFRPIPDTPVASAGFVEDAFAGFEAFRKEHFGFLENAESTEKPESSADTAAERVDRLLEEIVFKPVAAIRGVSIPNPVKEIRELVNTVVVVTRVVVCVLIALGLLGLFRFCFGRPHETASTVPRYLS